MADTIKSSGTFTVTINGSVSKYDGDCTLSVSRSGSNAVSEVKTVDSASWQALSTGSLSDVRYMYFANESTGTLAISTSGSGVPIITTLLPNDHSIIAWSGSIGSTTLYAKCVVSASSNLYYILSEQ